MPAIADTEYATLEEKRVYTSSPFVVSGAGTVALTCTNIVSSAKNAATANSLLDIYHIDPSQTNPLNSIQANLQPLATKLAGIANQGQTFSETAGRDAVQTHLTELENTYLPIIRLANTCLQESLQVDQTALKTAQDKLDEAQSRLASITNPEEKVSYYEGWFPMVRPMTEPALLGIFGAAIFMLLMSVLVFLRLQGVEINIIIPEIIIPYFTLPQNASYYMYGGLATGLIGAIGYAYYVRNN
jgi:hypothetical protein